MTAVVAIRPIIWATSKPVFVLSIITKANLDAPQERERMEIISETICVELIWPVLRIITN